MDLAALLAEIDNELQNGFTHLTQEDLLALELDAMRFVDMIDARFNKIHAAASRREVHRSARERSGGMALANRCNISSRRGNQIINRADVLVHLLPDVNDAYEAGVLNAEQVNRIIRLANDDKLLEFVARDQHLFIDWADEPYKQYDANCEAWSILNDPTDPQTEAEKAHAKRRLAFAKGLDGVTLLQADMPDDCAAILAAALEPIEQLMYEADWAEAKERLGPDVCLTKMLRTPNQRRFDAFMQLIRQGAGAGTTDPGIAPVVRITMDYETFMRESERAAGEDVPEPSATAVKNFRCETNEGHSVSPLFAFDAALAGHVRRIVIGLDGRDIDISTKTRLFTGLKREAMLIRDRWCSTPGCSTPASRCEADHITRFSEGGLTRARDGDMKCGPCHRHKTRLETLGLWQQASERVEETPTSVSDE